jgi:hypothetical protein
MFANERRRASYVGVDRFSNWIGTIERFLQFEQWVKDVDMDSCHTEDALTKIEDYIPLLINRFKITVERRVGLGTKFIKLHLLLHQVEAHRKYGKLANTDSSFGETRHKHFAKEPGKQTQRRKETFDKEVAQRNVDSVLLSLGLSALPNCSAEPSHPTELLPRAQGAMYLVKSNHISKHPRSTCYVPLADERTHPGVRVSLQLLSEHVAASANCSGDISTYHTLIIGGNIYHCCPNYQQKPWYDWAQVHDLDGIERTMLLLLIFKHTFVSLTQKTLPNDACDLSSNQTYVLGQYLNGDETSYRTHEESEMLFSATLEDGIRCIPSSHVKSPIAVYSDYDFEDHQQLTGLVPTGYFGIIHPRSRWADFFYSELLTT